MTVTIITFVVGVLAFRRMTRDYPSVVPALGDVLRVALFVALPLFVGSLVFRSDLDELGGGWIAEAAKDVSNGDSASWGVSAPSALFSASPSSRSCWRWPVLRVGTGGRAPAGRLRSGCLPRSRE